MDELKAELLPWLGKPKWKLGNGRATLYYSFNTETESSPRRVKIEINTREHFNHLDIKSVAYTVNSPWFTGTANIKTYALEELLGTKLRALYQRKKGRDLYDFLTVFNHEPILDFGKIVECFQVYMQKEGHLVSRADFEQNLHHKLKDSIFLNDIAPLLVEGNSYDHKLAAKAVTERVITLLPGDTWRGNKNYST